MSHDRERERSDDAFFKNKIKFLDTNGPGSVRLLGLETKLNKSKPFNNHKNRTKLFKIYEAI